MFSTGQTSRLGPPTTLAELVNDVVSIANMLMPVIIALALFAFIWGMFRYITAGDDTSRINEAKKVALYGIIGLFVMLAFWGFVLLLGRSVF